jgi:hypothetical protein
MDDTIIFTNRTLDLKEEGDLNYKDTTMNLFWVLRDYRDGNEEPFYLDKTKGVFEIEFVH